MPDDADHLLNELADGEDPEEPHITVISTERFKRDLLQVYSTRVYHRIMDDLELLQYAPEMGSAEVPESIKEEFGSDIRKLSIAPFLVLYKVLPDIDSVLVLGMVAQRRAR